MQALKYTQAPLTVATGDGVGVAILLEFLDFKVVARCQVTVGAERIVILDDGFPKLPVFRVVPDIQDAVLGQVAEHFGADIFVPTGDKAAVTVPEEIAGMDITPP